MVVSDRTYISSLIGVLYIVTCAHCFWRTRAIAREAEAARRCRAILSGAGRSQSAASRCARSAAVAWCRITSGALSIKANAQGAGRIDQTLLLRSLADRLRGSNGFGAFASRHPDEARPARHHHRLHHHAGADRRASMPPTRSRMKSSMGLMSDGMAVAMYTTLAGLVGSILVQHSILHARRRDPARVLATP